MRSLFGRRGQHGPRTRLFFATDIHGSERCFRKWLNAGRVYEAQSLVLGGDMTGKSLVPIVANGAGWSAELHGERLHAGTEAELDALRTRVRMTGRYEVLLPEAERRQLDDPARLGSVFAEAMRSSVAGWMALLDERLDGSGIAVTTMLGNDDDPAIADVLRASTVATYAEDGIVVLPGGHEMVSVGFSTPTPWLTPREVGEDALAELIDAQARQLSEPARAIFNLHCPPADTHLDQAPRLDDHLRPVVGAAGPAVASVGSRAVREAIERWQPLLGLHGHVHESAGSERIGRTLCVNPGSDYGLGVLRGAIVDLDDERGVRSWQLVQA